MGYGPKERLVQNQDKKHEGHPEGGARPRLRKTKTRKSQEIHTVDCELKSSNAKYTRICIHMCVDGYVQMYAYVYIYPLRIHMYIRVLRPNWLGGWQVFYS